MAGASEKRASKEEAKERNIDRAVSSSRSLHNFTFPSGLNWGYQKHLRCIRASHSCRTVSNSVLNSTPHNRQRSNSPISIPVPRSSLFATSNKKVKTESPITVKAESPIKATTSVAAVSACGTTGMEAVREKLMSDLKVEADRLTLLNLLEDKEKHRKPSEDELPWNLRTRSGKASNEGGNVGLSPLQSRFLLAREGDGSGYQQRPRFSLPISKEEMETDFLLMTGAKPPRRPKKRPKTVQKQMDASFPGSWLTEVTPETYKVPDAHEPRGKSEGAKERP